MKGKTIFLNSHLLSEVEMISDRVAILDKGALVRIGTVSELTRSERQYRIEVAPEQQEQFARTMAQWTTNPTQGSAVTIDAPTPGELNACIDRLRGDGLLIMSVTPIRHSLEELFIDIIGKGERGA
jgi:ABC-2 type transport system ATP-binding protein